MSDILRFLCCVVVILMTGIPVGGHPITEHPPNNTEDNGYYNIYSKIDLLEKDLHHLQTSVNNRNKLLKQVFLTFMELEVDPAFPDLDLKSLVLQIQRDPKSPVLQTLSKNGNIFYNSSVDIFYTLPND